jgi:uncharacterized membrane protein
MVLAGRLHPLLVHFPIALILAAGAGELIAMLTGRAEWHVVAVANIRAGAWLAVLTSLAGWLFASANGIDPSRALEWHRWLGSGAAMVAVVAALTSTRIRSRQAVRLFRLTLIGAVMVVGLAAHVGASLVWGADFLHP